MILSFAEKMGVHCENVEEGEKNDSIHIRHLFSCIQLNTFATHTVVRQNRHMFSVKTPKKVCFLHILPVLASS